MTILAAGPTDSGAILHPDIVDTHVLDVGEGTRNLSRRARRFPPTQALRLADADPDSAVETGELPVWLPTWPEAEALQEPPIAPPPKVARPWFYRGRRRVRELRPAWAYLAVGAGLGSVGTVVLQLAGIAALVVWR
jgi:hypothetical protein